MLFNNAPIGLINNPLTNSVFVEQTNHGLIVPGNQEFIATEDSLKIITESGFYLITE
jgi:hypothetical protein